MKSEENEITSLWYWVKITTNKYKINCFSERKFKGLLRQRL